MKPKYLLTAALIVGVAKAGFAQYSQDALRFSTFQTGSTARIKAVGNAGTALGGDLSSVGGNPAGIGFFTRSEMSLTPEFNGAQIGANYLGQGTNTSKSNLNLNNAAIVFYSRLNTPKGQDKTKGWLSLNFGIGYDRTNNFYEDVNYSGRNNANSITNYYANDANANNLSSNSLGAWGYNEYLIDAYATTGGGSTYKSNAYAGVNQNATAIRTGGQSELSLSMGANYSNKLYLGFGIGITSLRYNTTNSFTEVGKASTITSTSTVGVDQNYTNVYSQDQETKGTGFNAKFGFIYKPVEAVRIGAVLTTPTWYNIDDNYNEGMSTRLSTTGRITDGPVNYPFSYNLRTPLKVAGGMSVFIGHYGFISGDVEYLDYSSMHLGGDYSSQADNNDIRTLYQSTVNVHLGAEARLTSNFLLRGGYALQGDPIKNNVVDGKINTVSGGLGYRSGVYYIDATYTQSKGHQALYPYEIGTDSPVATLDKTFNNVYVTFGMRF